MVVVKLHIHVAIVSLLKLLLYYTSLYLNTKKACADAKKYCWKDRVTHYIEIESE